jgi:SpoVK/Ycf46/Vps4 family AAA+-type ATPase
VKPTAAKKTRGSDQDGGHYTVDRTYGTVEFGNGQNGESLPGYGKDIHNPYSSGAGDVGNISTDTPDSPYEKKRIAEICRAIKQSLVPHSGRRPGRKLRILFSGPSCTRMIPTAEMIAAETGLELYKIDLSSIISEYLTETENPLNEIFALAEASGAILFFDEANALFGNRKETCNRHARIGDEDLLQKIEGYDGVLIVSCNLPGKPCEIFRQRADFILRFT